MANKKPVVNSEPVELSCDDCLEPCEGCPVTELIEPQIEVVEQPVEAVLAHGWANTYVVKAEASYAVLGASLKPAGMSSHEYALHLHSINGGKPLTAGTIIKL